MVWGKEGGCFTVGARARRFTLNYPASAGDARIVVIPLMMVPSYCDLIPG